eukprot:29560-Eustigmatos_ZCMA.PRE.1
MAHARAVAAERHRGRRHVRGAARSKSTDKPVTRPCVGSVVLDCPSLIASEIVLLSGDEAIYPWWLTWCEYAGHHHAEIDSSRRDQATEGLR